MVLRHQVPSDVRLPVALCEFGPRRADPSEFGVGTTLGDSRGAAPTAEVRAPLGLVH
jgi:hypothetical protein